MTGMKCDIVIIDTGCEISHPRLVKKDIVNLQVIQKAEGNYSILHTDQDNDEVGHGTAICNIVCSHFPRASILMIKIFDKDLVVNEDLLLFSLEYIGNNIECKIVNLSLGISTLEHYDDLYRICDWLDKKGVMLISAFDNDGSISFPAAMKNVIGVTSDEHCLKNTDYYVCASDIVNICAKGNAQKIAWLEGRYSIGQGNSYACAHVSGIALNIIANISIDNRKELVQYMKKQQEFFWSGDVKEKSTECIKESISKYKKVAVFPFNKEIHSLIRFQSLLPFEIIDVFDIKHSINVGATTNTLLDLNEQKSYIIKNIKEIEWNTIDTIILGHTGHLISTHLMERSLLNWLLSSADFHNKAVFSFDALPKEYLSNQKFVSPPLFHDHKMIPFGKLYHQAKPVLAIFGTSSKQGKFSLQLGIRKKMLERGYSIGQLGTEPSSLLFGMDECFHFGYHSEMNISRFETISLLNEMMYNISRKEVDLIITGCQSETLLTGEGNLFNYPLPQIEFLFGILPDAVILVINPFDEIDLIKRTIDFIEACVECKVIAVVIFPMDINKKNFFLPKVHITREKYHFLKKVISEIKNLPCFLLDDDDHLEKLIDVIENAFL